MRYCLIIFLWQAMFVPLLAQQTYFRFDRITTHDGLPTDYTTKILQDKQGFIWIGTSEGLCRYDGYHVTTFTYNPSQPHSLVNNYIFDMSEDENGNIWIITAGGWCEMLFNTQTFLNKNDFKNFHGTPPVFFADHILADHHHHVFIGANNGSCIINLQDSSFEQLHFSPPDTIPVAGIIHMYQDDDGLVWLSFQNCTRVYDPLQNKFYSSLNNPYLYPLEKGKLTLFKSGNTVWIGGFNAGIFACDIKRQTRLQVGKDTTGLKEFTTDVGPDKMIADTKGNLWLVLKDKGIYYMDFAHNNFQIITNKPGDPNSIPSINLNDIMVDRDGNVWITSNKGVARWNNTRENFQLLPYTDYIPASFIPPTREKIVLNAVMEDDSAVWLSTASEGLIEVSKNNTSPCRRMQIDSGDLVSDMNRVMNYTLKDRNGNIWVSTQDGYAKYDGQHECLIPYFLNRHDISGNIFYQVTMMLQDSDGIIWLAAKKGLGKLNPSTNTVEWISLPVTHETGVPLYITGLAAQNDSVIWLTTENGLFSFNKTTNKFIRYASENLGDAWKAFDYCTDAVFVSDSVMFLASQFDGLIRFTPQKKTFKIYTTNDGLSSDNLCSLFADSYGGLWVTTTNGLSRLNLRTGTFSRYDNSNGIKEISFDTWRGFFPEKDGNVLLVDGSYILRFNPLQFVHAASAPSITFTSFEKYDEPVFYQKPLDEMENIRITYDVRFFTIRFSTFNFENASRTQYAYKLAGFDDKWYKSHTPDVSYSNLSGGTYTLHVKASLDGNHWGREKLLTIVVTPPFWLTAWFRLAICFVVSIIIYFLYWYRKQQRLQLENFRARISSDLHDDVGSTLTTIIMMSAMAEQAGVNNSGSAESWLKRIGNNARDMMDKMRDIVWTINPSEDVVSEIVTRMRQYSAQLLEPLNIAFEFFIDDQVYTLRPDFLNKRNLYLVFKEAMNNAAKYAKCTKIIIRLEEKNAQLEMSIADNGQGFDADVQSGGNGLRNMRQRAEQLNGKLFIESSASNGTRITLRAPITRIRYFFLKRAR